jgi:hypothetical protein
MTTRISVDLDELTWGEMIGFVDTARSAGVASEDPVAQVSDLLDDSTVTAFEITLSHTMPIAGPSISPPVADEVRSFLTLISEQDNLSAELRERLAVVRALTI